MASSTSGAARFSRKYFLSFRKTLRIRRGANYTLENISEFCFNFDVTQKRRGTILKKKNVIVQTHLPARRDSKRHKIAADSRLSHKREARENTRCAILEKNHT